MTIGGTLDYIDSYLEMKNPDKNKSNNEVRKASQQDMDLF